MDRPRPRRRGPWCAWIQRRPLPDEKQLNIGVATYLEGDLTAFAYVVRKTQNSDSTYFTLTQRRRIANGELENDLGFRDSCRLFISTHMNSATTASPFGTETYYPTIKYGAKKKGAYLADSTAAKRIHQDLMANADLAFLFCSNDRGIKPKNYAVLRRTNARAILIEVCFISNQCQFNNIITAGDQALIADGIAAGVTNVLTAARSGPDVETTWESGPAADAGEALGSGRVVRGTILQEGFEGVTFPPTGWSIQTAGAPIPFTWHRTTAGLYVGTGMGSALVGGEYGSPNDEWLITPSVPLGATDDAISFLWSGSHLWSSAVNATCSIRLSGSSTWTVLWSLATDEPPADPFLYRRRVVDISAWNGETVEFAFRVAGTNGADFVLDDVAVGDFDPTATAANDLCSNATLLTSPFSVQDVTCYAANDMDPYTAPPGSCVGNELSGPDLFYELTASAGDTLQASLASEWGAGLYLIDGCATPNCLAGLYAEDGRVLPSLEYEFPAPGTYYLVVDGEDGSCGPFCLTGEVRRTAVGASEVLGDQTGPQVTVRPNPSAGGVSFEVRTPGLVSGVGRLTVYDISGRRLFGSDVSLASGAGQFAWDGRDQRGSRVGPGVYLVRAEVGNRVADEKFTLIR